MILLTSYELMLMGGNVFFTIAGVDIFTDILFCMQKTTVIHPTLVLNEGILTANKYYLRLLF